jgi:NO-binding membrane sensor protein with MHYT domain
MSNATNTSTVIPLQRYAELEGQIISRSFIPGYVVSSYFVSFLGAWTALELISRRTAMRGRYNWYDCEILILFNHLIQHRFLLAGSSFSMGGIAIWSMHYIGNRAIILDDDQPELQIVYGNGYTVISFFMPVAVLFLVFAAVGSNATINNTRVVLGGALTGFTICGMHYLAQAGIANYDCVYPVSFVVGAILIAVAASIASLCIFFLFHLTWDTKWWKRPICASVLASAVSGMHWLASVGTQYRLKHLDPTLAKIVSRILTVIVALVLVS